MKENSIPGISILPQEILFVLFAILLLPCPLPFIGMLGCYKAQGHRRIMRDVNSLTSNTLSALLPVDD